jgi:hypothetical protein
MSFNKSGISSMRFKHFRKPVLIAGVLIGGATMFAGSAQAALINSTCSFVANPTSTQCLGPSGVGWTTVGGTPSGTPPNPLWLGDKLLNIVSYSFGNFQNIGGGSIAVPGRFDFSYLDAGPVGNSLGDAWNVRTIFDTAVTGDINGGSAVGDLNYTLQITDPGFKFLDVQLDSAHIGTGVTVTKAIAGLTPSPYLTSIDGGLDSKPLGGTFVDISDHYDVQVNSGLNSFNNGFTQTPAPLPILGVGAAFGSIRKLRKFSSRLKTFSMG